MGEGEWWRDVSVPRRIELCPFYFLPTSPMHTFVCFLPMHHARGRDWERRSQDVRC